MQQQQRVRVEPAGHAVDDRTGLGRRLHQLIRFPQLSSKVTALIGPICFGSPRNFTPRAASRLNSASMSVVMKAVAGMPASNSAFCQVLGRRESHRLEDDFRAFGTPSGETTVSQRYSPIGMSDSFRKPRLSV